MLPIIHTLRASLLLSRILCNTEAELQQGIAEVLTSAKIGFIREFNLSSNARLDFWLPDHAIVIEAKLETSSTTLLRQVHRYASNDFVKAVLVVCIRPYQLPETLAHKPVVCIDLWKTMI